MRKFSLLLLAMLMVSSMVFAQVQVEYELEAEATATFGVNLDRATDGTDLVAGPTTGFALSNNIDLSITFIEEMTTEFGEGDVYGWIEVDEFEITVDADGPEGTAPALGGTNGDITAKVFMGPAYILVATAENEVNQAELGLNVDETILGATDQVSRADMGNAVAVGYTVPDLFNIELSIASVGEMAADDWSDNLFNNYVGAIYTETTLDALTIYVEASASVRSHYATGTDDDGIVDETEPAGDFGDNALLGVGVEYEMALNDMMTLVPYLGLDLYKSAGAGEADSSNSGFEGALDFEVIAGANVQWGADDLEVFGAASDETQGGVGVEVGFARVNAVAVDLADTYEDALWVRLGFAEDGGDDGFLPVVGGAVLVEYASTTPTVDGESDDAINMMSFGLELDADLGVVSPFFGLMFADTDLDTDNDHEAGVYSEGLTMNIGTDIEVIPATTFTVKYTSGNLMLDEGDAIITQYDTNQYTYAAARGDAAVTSMAGTFTIATTIEY